VTVSFTPHLVPMNRGILTTIYGNLVPFCDTNELLEAFRRLYRDEPFVRVLPAGQLPNTRHVRGSNFCDIGVHADPRTGRAVVVTAIDNLVKGASGQAIQNMNLMMGFDETAGLKHAGIFP
jgi:N-acetyl-gamma-glutamyl-phosphate reductase